MKADSLRVTMRNSTNLATTQANKQASTHMPFP